MLTTGFVGAQGSASEPLAIQLVELMSNAESDAIAAKDSTNDDRFVAALAFPGQLLVVSARYEVPVYLEQKIAAGQFREVYIDLNSASIPGTKVLITDAGADGLLSDDESFDSFDSGDLVIKLNDDWRSQGIEQADYRQAVSDADQQYASILKMLIAQVQ
jgi:hypothetical protein